MLSLLPMWAWNKPALPLVSSTRDIRCNETVYQTHPVTGVGRGSDWNGGKRAGFCGGAGVALDLTLMRMEGFPVLTSSIMTSFTYFCSFEVSYGTLHAHHGSLLIFEIF